MTHTPLSEQQKERQIHRNGAGRYTRKMPWDTPRENIIMVNRAETLTSSDERGLWLDNIYAQIDARTKPEYEYPADTPNSASGILVEDRFTVQLDKSYTFFIRKVYSMDIVQDGVAKCRHRLRFGIFGAPDNGEGKSATLSITVAQLRALKPVSLDEIPDTDFPWTAYS